MKNQPSKNFHFCKEHLISNKKSKGSETKISLLSMIAWNKICKKSPKNQMTIFFYQKLKDWYKKFLEQLKENSDLKFLSVKFILKENFQLLTWRDEKEQTFEMKALWVLDNMKSLGKVTTKKLREKWPLKADQLTAHHPKSIFSWLAKSITSMHFLIFIFSKLFTYFTPCYLHASRSEW